MVLPDQRPGAPESDPPSPGLRRGKPGQGWSNIVKFGENRIYWTDVILGCYAQNRTESDQIKPVNQPDEVNREPREIIFLIRVLVA
jgi:hypothetical protein